MRHRPPRSALRVATPPAAIRPSPGKTVFFANRSLRNLWAPRAYAVSATARTCRAAWSGAATEHARAVLASSASSWPRGHRCAWRRGPRRAPSKSPQRARVATTRSSRSAGATRAPEFGAGGADGLGGGRGVLPCWWASTGRRRRRPSRFAPSHFLRCRGTTVAATARGAARPGRVAARARPRSSRQTRPTRPSTSWRARRSWGGASPVMVTVLRTTDYTA